MMSTAAPSGVEGRPWLSRRSARWRVARGQPCCSARLVAMAASRALELLVLVGLWFCRKTSPTVPSQNRPIVQVYRRPVASSSKVKHCLRSLSRRRISTHPRVGRKRRPGRSTVWPMARQSVPSITACFAHCSRVRPRPAASRDYRCRLRHGAALAGGQGCLVSERVRFDGDSGGEMTHSGGLLLTKRRAARRFAFGREERYLSGSWSPHIGLLHCRRLNRARLVPRRRR